MVVNKVEHGNTATQGVDTASYSSSDDEKAILEHEVAMFKESNEYLIKNLKAAQSQIQHLLTEKEELKDQIAPPISSHGRRGESGVGRNYHKNGGRRSSGRSNSDWQRHHEPFDICGTDSSSGDDHRPGKTMHSSWRVKETKSHVPSQSDREKINRTNFDPKVYDVSFPKLFASRDMHSLTQETSNGQIGQPHTSLSNGTSHMGSSGFSTKSAVLAMEPPTTSTQAAGLAIKTRVIQNTRGPTYYCDIINSFTHWIFSSPMFECSDS